MKSQEVSRLNCFVSRELQNRNLSIYNAPNQRPRPCIAVDQDCDIELLVSCHSVGALRANETFELTEDGTTLYRCI